jgi:hypothetical protein
MINKQAHMAFLLLSCVVFVQEENQAVKADYETEGLKLRILDEKDVGMVIDYFYNPPLLPLPSLPL